MIASFAYVCSTDYTTRTADGLCDWPHRQGKSLLDHMVYTYPFCCQPSSRSP